jgi:diguanylate cyclase (GGDEF)-like protein/PAS domain S-box-containing protein
MGDQTHDPGFLRAVLEHGTDVVAVIDKTGTLQYASPAARWVLGYEPETAIGTSVLGLVHPDDVHRAAATLERSMAAGPGVLPLEQLRLLHADGSFRDTEVASYNLLDDPSVRGFVLSIRDVSERAAAEREAERRSAEFSALIEQSSDIITVLEPDGTWRFSSDAGTRLLGHPKGIEPAGGIFELLHPDDIETAARAFADVVAGTRPPDEPLVLRVRAVDGSVRVFETVARDLTHDPAVRGIVLNSRDITDRIDAEEALRATDARFRAIAEHATDLVTITNSVGDFSYVSRSVTRLLGWTPEELIGKPSTHLMHPEDRAIASEAVLEYLAGRAEPRPVEHRVRHKDGTWRVFESITTNLTDEPSIGGLVSNARDITERRRAEQRAQQLTEVLEQSNEVVVLSEPAGHLVYANQRARELLGLGTGHDVGELSSIESRERLRIEIMPFVRRHGLWSGELTLRTTAGDEVPMLATVQAHREDGEIVLLSTIAHDITEMKKTQHRLEYEATHDALTGLPNRAMFNEVGEQALERAARHAGSTAVLFLDLDGFKEVNDSLGHDAGDLVLVEIAKRLRVAVRGGDLVARIGGDEFCILCELVAGEAEMYELGNRIVGAVSTPLIVHGRDVQVGTSVGIALDDGAPETIGTLVRDADVALYHAKRAGKSRVAVFDDSLDTARDG